MELASLHLLHHSNSGYRPYQRKRCDRKFHLQYTEMCEPHKRLTFTKARSMVELAVMHTKYMISNRSKCGILVPLNRSTHPESPVPASEASLPAAEPTRGREVDAYHKRKASQRQVLPVRIFTFQISHMHCTAFFEIQVLQVAGFGHPVLGHGL